MPRKKQTAVGGRFSGKGVVWGGGWVGDVRPMMRKVAKGEVPLAGMMAGGRWCRVFGGRYLTGRRCGIYVMP